MCGGGRRRDGEWEALDGVDQAGGQANVRAAMGYGFVFIPRTPVEAMDSPVDLDMDMQMCMYV